MNGREQLFEERINATLVQLGQLLVEKGREYRRNNNPFHNFERGAELTELKRLEVLDGFRLKHLISIEDMRKDLDIGISPDPNKVHEKYNDVLVYFLIEKAMMLEYADQ